MLSLFTPADDKKYSSGRKAGSAEGVLVGVLVLAVCVIVCFCIYAGMLSSRIGNATLRISLDRGLGLTIISEDHKTKILNVNNSYFGILRSSIDKLDAEEWGVFELRYPARNLELELAFYWRTAENPTQLYQTTLEPTPWGTSTALLKGNSFWSGTILEHGIAIRSAHRTPIRTLPEFPISISDPRFEKATPINVGAAILTQWFQVRLWRGSTINVYIPPDDASRFIRPVVFLILVFLVFFCVECLRRRFHPPMAPAYLACLAVIPFLIWLGSAGPRFVFTSSVLGSEKIAEKKPFLPIPIVRRSVSAMQKLVPHRAPTHRVLVVSRTPYYRMKVIYELLPLNVVPVRVVDIARARLGDLVLVLDEVGLSFDAKTGLIRYRGRKLGRAVLLYSDGGVMIFRMGRPQ